MDPEEKEIADFLKSWPGQFVASKEICRRAGGKWRFREDEKWALPVIQRMLEKGMLEADTTGHVRLMPDRAKRDKKKWWASPQMKKILEESGKDFDGVVDVEKDIDPDQK